MWQFRAKQKTFEIGKVKIGGVPGERPVVLIGTLFHLGQKILTDAKKGEFDKAKAEELINIQDEFSDKTGNPCMIDLVASGPDAISKELEFVMSVTDAPILIDPVGTETKKAAINYIKESNLAAKVVYNSITVETKQEELDSIKEAGITSAILLAYSSRVFTTQGRIDAINSLLSSTEEIGIKRPMIDTCIMDIPSLGMGCYALFKLKDEFGVPIGGGTDNAISTWRGLKSKMGKQARESSTATAAAVAVMVGADFILYGPIKVAPYVFPSVAMVDAAFGQLIMEQGKMINKGHPLFKIP
ncbi:MAG: tetrahydromethanopterin S-methyltransferase subunit H [Candidatus Hodarchaeota archaeon]